MYKKIGIAISSILLTLVVFLGVQTVYAATTSYTVNHVNKPTGYTQNYTFFNATTTTATSTSNYAGDGAFAIGGAKKVTVYFSRGGVIQPNTGSTLFKIQVTPDGTNWYDFNQLNQNVATSTSAWEVNSVTITAATSTVIVGLDLQFKAFYGMRCIAVETTDGEHTCMATAEF